jgi:hypothetical protein
MMNRWIESMLVTILLLLLLMIGVLVWMLIAGRVTTGMQAVSLYGTVVCIGTGFIFDNQRLKRRRAGRH